MKENEYKTPKLGGVSKIREVAKNLRKRTPSESLKEILKQKKGSDKSNKKVAKQRKPSRDVEL